MKLEKIQDTIPKEVYTILKESITELRPSQEKAIQAGLFENKNILVCTPTASGKTLISELAFTKNILENKGKAIYIVPLKALASEKNKDFRKRYDHLFKTALSIGNLDGADPYLASYDLIVCTAEKLDSLLRHHTPWIKEIGTVIVDEVHLLNDPGRGPTLEIILTMLRKIVPDMQLIALSATIGNPKELAAWLQAELVQDTWRPVELKKGTYLDGELKFYD